MTWTESALTGMNPLCRALVTGPLGDLYFALGIILIFTIFLSPLPPILITCGKLWHNWKRKSDFTTPELVDLGKTWLIWLSPWLIFFTWLLLTDCYIWYA